MSLETSYLANIHSDLLPFVKLASDEELAQFVRAQISISIGDEAPVLDGLAKALLEAHCSLMDRLDEARRKRSESGRKGGNPALKRCTDEVNRSSTVVNHSLTTAKPMPEQGSTEDKPITVTITDTTTVSSLPPLPPASGGDAAGESSPAESSFDSFWAAYPNKQGKGAAQKAWNKIKPGKALVTKILQAVELYKASRQWNRDDGQYIPNPATWLNQRRWEDEPTPAGTGNPRDEARMSAMEEIYKYGDI
ncbi:MAG: hypothetical protein FWE19_00410 [Oscillospiraceae bacterium]|nr:hypothetical protein [Oscillospiraceae bacterium]